MGVAARVDPLLEVRRPPDSKARTGVNPSPTGQNLQPSIPDSRHEGVAVRRGPCPCDLSIRARREHRHAIEDIHQLVVVTDVDNPAARAVVRARDGLSVVEVGVLWGRGGLFSEF